MIAGSCSRGTGGDAAVVPPGLRLIYLGTLAAVQLSPKHGDELKHM